MEPNLILMCDKGSNKSINIVTKVLGIRVLCLCVVLSLEKNIVFYVFYFFD